ncbi:S8 family serine peptidase [Heyndrickxia oleronia]|uniref:S8 family serine peptidase n=1 Tax=Heyndrickxia oleronia TaxID=38875 RepID=UPI003F259401
MIKRSAAILLIFLLAFSSTALGASPKVASPQTGKIKASNNENVRVIIELKDDPKINIATEKGMKFSELNEKTKEELENDAIKSQNKVKTQISEQKVNAKFLHNFTTVVNGFSAEIKQGDIAKVEKIPNVKRVQVVHKYDMPKVQPEMKYSKELVQAQKAWRTTGFKGQGMIVGIIDTGIDYNHKDMKLSDDASATLTKDGVTKLKLANNLPGKYYTAKVPYGYNYMDKNSDIIDSTAGASMHGMHVAGTVAANGDEENGGIQGIAPEAQLLALKVFGNDPEMKSTYSDVYVKAIDDAIKLGADVLNMSLGSTAGFVAADDPEQEAIKRATDSGILMSISAGNSALLGDGYSTPFASNPDYGVVGSPGLATESLQVAAYENTNMDVDALSYTVDGQDPVNAAFLSAGSTHPKDYTQKSFEILDAGLGKAEEFAGKDFKGKYALVQRGEIAFTDKALNAQAAGAIGVIIYNNSDGIVNMATDAKITIPYLFMLKSDGDNIKAALAGGKKVTLDFKGEQQTITNPDAGKMSAFSSWGLTPSLDFKPEITAPGGQILSTLNNNKYGLMSGTSMAAPHVSGGAALVLERVRNQLNGTMKNAERVKLAKNLLMNTASPVTLNNVFVSPRRQGAGLMQLNAALTTPVIVTDSKTNEAKVALKEVKSDFVTFELTAKNLTDKEVTYEAHANAQTDKTVAKDNQLFVQPNTQGSLDLVKAGLAYVTVNGAETSTIKIPANSTAKVEVRVSVVKGDTDLSKQFPNGYWLEGFVTFKDPSDKNPELTVPYTGFKGEWDAAPIFDQPSWEARSFYGVTGVTTSIDDDFDFIGVNPRTGKVDPNTIAFSPDGDGVQDNAVPILSFLRNAKEVKYVVLDKDRKEIRTLRTDKNVRKDGYDSGQSTQFHLGIETGWDGKINGQVAKEGQYYLAVTGVIDYPEAQPQTIVLPVKVDVTKPKLEASFNSETQTVSVQASDNQGGSGLAYWDVLVDGKSVTNEAYYSMDDHKHTLEKIVAPDQELKVVAYDNAGNKTEQVITSGTDVTKPAIHLLTPEFMDALNTKEVEFSGYVTDKSKVTSLKIGDQKVDLKETEANKYEFSTTLKVKKDGIYETKLIAYDASGNFHEINRPYIVDTTAPKLKVKGTKATVDKDTDKVRVSLDVQDNFDDIRVYVNDSEIFAQELKEPYQMRAFNKTIEYDVNLNEGENTFVFKVVDIAGNETTKEVKIKRGK